MRCLRFILALGLVFLASLQGEAQGLLITPGPGETVSEPRPVITVQLPRDGSIPPEGVRMWVNGKDVTYSCLRTPFFVSYQPAGEMEAGPVSVRFTARERGGDTQERNWSFRVEPVRRIQSLSHDAEQELGEYDLLTVEMKAEPGGKAWFKIEGFGDRVAMEEVSEGLYRGSYEVHPGDHRVAAQVIGYLEFGRRVSTMEADRTVTLFGDLFRVKVLEPANGATVPINFEIKGRTRPRAKISVVPKVGFNEAISAPTRNDPTSTAGSIPAQADEHGNFSVRYGLPIKIPGMHLVLTILATDSEGNRSVPTILRLKF